MTVPAVPSALAELIRFAYLQCLDVLTTLAFLVAGTHEANPLVRAAIAFTGNPLTGLFYVKAIGMAMGLYCWRRNKQRVLARINVFYAGLIVWNMIALILTRA